MYRNDQWMDEFDLGAEVKRFRTMRLAKHIQATPWFLLFSPSPLEGEGWDEGEFK
jgi:hypothetical protein